MSCLARIPERHFQRRNADLNPFLKFLFKKQYVIGLQHVETYVNRNMAVQTKGDILFEACSTSIVTQVWMKNEGVQQIKNSNTIANNILITRCFAALLFSLLDCLTPRALNLIFDEALRDLFRSWSSLGPILLPNPSLELQILTSGLYNWPLPFCSSENNCYTLL